MISLSSQYRYNAFSFLFFIGTVLPAFLVLPLPGVGFTLPKLFIFSFTAAIGMLWLFLREDLSPFNVIWSQRSGRLMVYFAAVLLLSLTWSVMPIVSTLGSSPRFEGLLFYVVCFSYAICSLCLCHHPRGLRNVVYSIIASNAAVVLYGLLQLAHLDPFAHYYASEAFLGRVFSTLGQPNLLGSFIVLTMPFVGIKVLSETGKSQLLYATLLLVNLVVLVATASRGAMIGLILASLIFVGTIRPIIQEQLRKLSGLQKSLVILAATIVGVIAIVSFSQRFSFSNEIGRSWGSRQVIWSDSLKLIFARPQGYGLESMSLVYPKHMSSQVHHTESLTSIVDRAHNKPLDLLITLGPIGLVIYYAFVFSLVFPAWRSRQNHGVLFAGGMGITAYSISLLFGFESILTSVFFWFIAGLMIGVMRQLNEGRQEEVNSRLNRGIVLVASMLCIASCVVYFQWFQSRNMMSKAEAAFYEGNLQQSVTQYANASLSFSYDRSLLVRLTETSLIAVEHARDDETKKAYLQAASHTIDRLENVTNGRDGMVYLLRAWQLALQGDAKAVDTNVQKARELMPRTVDTYRIAGYSYKILGDTRKRTAMHNELILLLPPFWKDKQSEAGRILWKENPWLSEIVTDSRIRDFNEWE